MSRERHFGEIYQRATLAVGLLAITFLTIACTPENASSAAASTSWRNCTQVGIKLLKSEVQPSSVSLTVQAVEKGGVPIQETSGIELKSIKADIGVLEKGQQVVEVQVSNPSLGQNREGVLFRRELTRDQIPNGGFAYMLVHAAEPVTDQSGKVVKVDCTTQQQFPLINKNNGTLGMFEGRTERKLLQFPSQTAKISARSRRLSMQRRVESRGRWAA